MASWFRNMTMQNKSSKCTLSTNKSQHTTNNSNNMQLIIAHIWTTEGYALTCFWMNQINQMCLQDAKLVVFLKGTINV